MRNPDTREGQHNQLLTFNFDENIGFLRALGVEQSFDVIHRKLGFAGVRFGLFLDGFAKDDIMMILTNRLSKLQRGELVLTNRKKSLY
ncbi:hypothetical protein P7H21_10380 [Paenibacillus larvae]|nr:hypothetical protein [Paenibacillus larvae]MDT2304291.1 hypothetical protein [Paenibacillus larvae]